MDKYCKELGELFKAARNKIGLNQSTIAESNFLHITEISAIETGKRYLKINRYKSICNDLGIPIETVMDFKNKSELLRMATNPTKADWKKIYKNYTTTPVNAR